MAQAEGSDAAPGLRGGDVVRRHRLSTRLWHWLNVLALAIMLMSGLMIFNAHPTLYWGQFGANPDHAWLALAGSDGIAFPGWITIPSTYSLADARIWHFAFAWLLAPAWLVYALVSLANGHLRRDLLPSRAELAPSHILHDIGEHARLRFPTGAAALRYNVLQKLAYLGVLALLLPLVILTGMAMSPTLDAALPWLIDLLGGRATARSLHFLAASGLVVFLGVHLLMVVLAGPVNEVRSMITGRFRLPEEKP